MSCFPFYSLHFDNAWRSPLNDQIPAEERRVLACIERLYDIHDTPDWFAALGILVDAFDGQTGVLLDMTRPQCPQVLAIAGAGFAWLDCPLLDGTTGRHGRQLGIHTVQGDGMRLAWLLDGLPDEAHRVRIACMREHLRLAIDFAKRHEAKGTLSGRLSNPTPARIAHVEDRLTTLNERAGACVLLAARGYTNSQISDYLQVAPGTVARSLQEAYRHLGVAGRSDLDVAALLTQPKPKSAWLAH